jgi:hypothetical protein
MKSFRIVGVGQRTEPLIPGYEAELKKLSCFVQTEAMVTLYMTLDLVRDSLSKNVVCAT